jgi:Uma2 family endonuclease
MTLTEEQFLELCGLNDELRIEINARGDLELMPPTHAETSNRNFRIVVALGHWALEDGTGEGFESNAGFTLCNGALRSPDASWVLRSRLAELPEPDRYKFAPICPDFVIELRSDSDRLRDIQAKMEEYVENGARLGWLIDPFGPRRVYVYRPGASVEVLEAPKTLSGDPELPGFVLDLERIWEPSF